MNIAITEKNSDRINEAIRKEEGRATARTVTAKDILKAVEDLEHKLGIRKKDMTNITAVIDVNAQDFPRAYKYTPYSTIVVIVRKKSGWNLVNVERDWTRSPKQKYTVKLTPEAERAIIDSKRFMA